MNRVSFVLAMFLASPLCAMENNSLALSATKAIVSCAAGAVTNFVAIKMINSKLKASPETQLSTETVVGLAHVTIGQKYFGTPYALGCVAAHLHAIYKRQAAMAAKKAQGATRLNGAQEFATREELEQITCTLREHEGILAMHTDFLKKIKDQDADHYMGASVVFVDQRPSGVENNG